MAGNQSTQRQKSNYKTFEQWQAGEAQAHEVAASLVNDLEEISQVLSGFESIKERLRDQLSQVIATMDGQKHTTPSGYTLVLTAPGKNVRYDRETLDALVIELAGNEDDDLRAIASRINLARKESERAGSLRIEAPKRRKEDRQAA